MHIVWPPREGHCSAVAHVGGVGAVRQAFPGGLSSLRGATLGRPFQSAPLARGTCRVGCASCGDRRAGGARRGGGGAARGARPSEGAEEEERGTCRVGWLQNRLPALPRDLKSGPRPPRGRGIRGVGGPPQQLPFRARLGLVGATRLGSSGNLGGAATGELALPRGPIWHRGLRGGGPGELWAGLRGSAPGGLGRRPGWGAKRRLRLLFFCCEQPNPGRPARACARG